MKDTSSASMSKNCNLPIAAQGALLIDNEMGKTVN